MTDEHTSGLLERAADRIPVGPPPVEELLRRGRAARARRRLTVAAAAAAAVATVAAVGGVTVGISLAGPDPTPPPVAGTPEAPDAPTRVESGTTADGRSYGPLPPGAAQLPLADLPDLVAVEGDAGVVGFVETRLLFATDEAAPGSPAEALEEMADAGRRVLPVYAADGVTRVDTFTVAGPDDSPSPG